MLRLSVVCHSSQLDFANLKGSCSCQLAVDVLLYSRGMNPYKGSVIHVLHKLNIYRRSLYFSRVAHYISGQIVINAERLVDA